MAARGATALHLPGCHGLGPPLPRWLAAMSVNADAARCRPSLSVGILVAEGGISPRPAGTYHQRLEVVLASKANRDGTVVLAVIIDW